MRSARALLSRAVRGARSRGDSPNRQWVSSLICVKRLPGPGAKLELDRSKNTATMDNDRFPQYRKLLEAQRAQLLAEVREKIAASGKDPDFSSQSKITDDDGLADAAAEMEVALVVRESQELQEIEAALLRLTDGSYGRCTDCSGDIGQARLTASPAARRCLICQEQYEHAQGQMHAPGT